MIIADIDYDKLRFERSQSHSWDDCVREYAGTTTYTTVDCEEVLTVTDYLDEYPEEIYRIYHKNPFIPKDEATFEERCHEIFSIQAAGLAGRMERSYAKKLIIGISGGLDSTLALLVCAETCKLLGRPTSDIIAITMPGFGTTGHTKSNAEIIMEMIGAQSREIPIGPAVELHFKDIGHDPEILDTTYENAQARERTQILMDIANKEGGIVVGTGDLSEIALGWSTYNGDHMSMYAVNCSVPKTLVTWVIKWVMHNKLDGQYSKNDRKLADALQSILDTPISPELLPPDKSGKIAQKTEDTIGPYIVHDFFLYYFLRHGMSPEKLLYIATQTFEDDYNADDLRKFLNIFMKRFFTQQFKRSCIPDGPKVGTVSLSPRGDWRQPSDIDPSIWLDF
jgi:NAD+ synthase (glutamine-hydrolysing)